MTIKTRTATNEYRDGYSRIFQKPAWKRWIESLARFIK